MSLKIKRLSFKNCGHLGKKLPEYSSVVLEYKLNPLKTAKKAKNIDNVPK